MLVARASDMMQGESHGLGLAPVRLAASDAEVLAKLLGKMLGGAPGAVNLKMRDALRAIKSTNVHDSIVGKLEALRRRDSGAAPNSHSAAAADTTAASSDSSIAVIVPRAAFLVLCNGFLSPTVTIPETSVPVVASVLEQLHWFANGSRLQVYGAGQQKHVEYLRLRSFEGASVSQGSEHLNDAFASAAPNLAEAGFYYEPAKSGTSGYCVHFETGASVPTTNCDSFRGLLTDTWSELEKLCPTSRLITGRPSGNVPLSVSISAMSAPSCIGPEFMPYEADAMLQDGLHITSMSVPLCERTSIVATSSSNGLLSVWSTSVSQSVASPALAYCIDTTSYKGDALLTSNVDSNDNNSDACIMAGKSASGERFDRPAFTCWTCDECETENDPSAGFDERCEMCDTANPNFKRLSSRLRTLTGGSTTSPSPAAITAAVAAVAAVEAHPWVCDTCESENEATMDRCEMCDSANPNQVTKQLRQASTDTIDDMKELEIYDDFMRRSGLRRRLASVQVVPLPSPSAFDEEEEDKLEPSILSKFQPCDTFQGPHDGFHFKAGPEGTGYYPDDDAVNGGESKSDLPSKKRKKKHKAIPDPGLHWADGWVAESICVHIVKGVYSGTDGAVMSTGPQQCMIRTAFDSVEPATPDMIEPKPPSGKDKRVMVIKVTNPGMEMQFKGRTGVVVRISGKEATVKFKASDPPSKHFTTDLANLAELDQQMQQPQRLQQQGFGAVGGDGGVLRQGSVQMSAISVSAEGTVIAVIAGNGVLGIRVYHQMLGDPKEIQFVVCDGVPAQGEDTASGATFGIDTDKPITSAFHRQTDLLLLGVTLVAKPGSAHARGAILGFAFDHTTTMLRQKQAPVNTGGDDPSRLVIAKADVSFSIVFPLSEGPMASPDDELVALTCVALFDDGRPRNPEALATLSRQGRLQTFHSTGALAVLKRPCQKDASANFTLERSCELAAQHAHDPSPFVDLCTVGVVDATNLQESGDQGLPVFAKTIPKMQDILNGIPDLVAARESGNVIVVRDLLASATLRRLEQMSPLDKPGETKTSTHTAEDGAASSSRPRSGGQPMTIREIKSLEARMRWRKLTFFARGPRGLLTCSSSPSGTDMRWRAQTAYGDAVWSDMVAGGEKKKPTTWICCKINGATWRNSASAEDRFTGARGPEYHEDATVLEERIGPGSNWLKCDADDHGIKYLPIVLNGEVMMFPKHGTDAECFKCVDPNGVAFRNSENMSDRYNDGQPGSFVKYHTQITSLGPANGIWIKISVPGAGHKYLPLEKDGRALFRRRPMKKNKKRSKKSMKKDDKIKAFVFEPFQDPTVKRVTGESKSSKSLETDLMIAPPLLRQHTDLLGARASADADELQWEIDLGEDCVLGLLKARLELQTEQLTQPQPAALFDGSGAGIVCPVDDSGKVVSSKSWTMEAWVRMHGEPKAHSVGIPTTILFKSTAPSEGAQPQIELLVHPNGALQLIVYTQPRRQGKSSRPLKTSLNQRTSLWLTNEKWFHVAATVSAVSSGRAEICLYVNGDFVSVDYVPLDKYRPVSERDAAPAGPLRIGCAGLLGGGFHGNIRHVRYWQGARTQSDIRDSMHTSSPTLVSSGSVSGNGGMDIRTIDTLVGMWPLTRKQHKGGAQYAGPFHFSEQRVSGHSGQRRGSVGAASNISWSTKRSDARLKVMDGGTTVTCTKKNYQTAIANECFSEGVHFWEIHVITSKYHSMSGGSEMFVGVGEKDINVTNCFVGQYCSSSGKRGWGYYSRTGKYSGGNSSYGQSFGKIGDIIGVTLDCDAGTLKYSVNGKDQGIAFNKGLKGLKLYPCVSLFTPEGQLQISITSSSTSSTKHGYFSGLEGAVERAEILQTSMASTSTSKPKGGIISGAGGGFGGGAGAGCQIASSSSANHSPSLSVISEESLVTPDRHSSNISSPGQLEWESIPTPYMDFAPLLELSVHIKNPQPFIPISTDSPAMRSRGASLHESLIVSENLDSSDVSLELKGKVGRRLVVRLRRFSRDEVTTKFKINSLKLSVQGRRLSQECMLYQMLPEFLRRAQVGPSMTTQPAVLYPSNLQLRTRLFDTISCPTSSSELCCLSLKMLEQGTRESNLAADLALLCNNSSPLLSHDDSNLSKIIKHCILKTHDLTTAQAALSFLQRVAELDEDGDMSAERDDTLSDRPVLGEFVIATILRLLPTLHTEAVSGAAISTTLKLMHMFWDHAPKVCLESAITYVVHLAKTLELQRQQTDDVSFVSAISTSPAVRRRRKYPYAYAARTLRSILNLHTCLMDEAFWPLGASAGISLVGKISHRGQKVSGARKPTVKYSMQTNFVSVNWKVKTSTPVETYVNFDT